MPELRTAAPERAGGFSLWGPQNGRLGISDKESANRRASRRANLYRARRGLGSELYLRRVEQRRRPVRRRDRARLDSRRLLEKPGLALRASNPRVAGRPRDLLQRHAGSLPDALANEDTKYLATLVRHKFLNAVSVGFIPGEETDRRDPATGAWLGYVY